MLIIFYFIIFCPPVQKLASEPLLKERMDMETLDGLGLVISKNAFNQKYVKTKTKLLWVYEDTFVARPSLARQPAWLGQDVGVVN